MDKLIKGLIILAVGTPGIGLLLGNWGEKVLGALVLLFLVGFLRSDFRRDHWK
jgi:hypothetical protein